MRGKSLCIGLRGAVLILTLTLFGLKGWAVNEVVLHSFHPEFRDGISPEAALIFDAAGNLYGTTNDGGAYGTGTAFEITP